MDNIPNQVLFEHRDYGEMMTLTEYWVESVTFMATPVKDNPNGDTVIVNKEDCFNPSLTY